MLAPKKTKHRKWQKGRSMKRTFENRGTKVSYGEFGLQALAPAWLNGNQIEAARRTVTNFLQREGRLWIRVFPDKPVTKKPPEVTLGGGKGDVDHYVFPVRIGRVILEIGDTTEAKAREAFRLAGFKLPFKTKFIKKEVAAAKEIKA